MITAIKNVSMYLIYLAILVAGIVFSPLEAKAGPMENPDNWFQWVDAEIGYQVGPDVSVDCDDNGNSVDGKRKVSGFASLDANIYRSTDRRFEFNARLWEHNSCDAQFDSQATGGPGLYIRYRIWGN